MHNTTFEQISVNLKLTLDIVENCGEAYRNGSDTIKKLMNQAIFEKFYISNGENTEFSVDVTFRAPYGQILEPIRDDISSVNAAMNRSSAKVSKYIGIAKDHIRKIFGCGLYAVNNSTLYETSSNDSNFFEPKSSSKVLLDDSPNFNTNAPPFEVRGCKVILGGAYLSQRVQNTN